MVVTLIYVIRSPQSFNLELHEKNEQNKCKLNDLFSKVIGAAAHMALAGLEDSLSVVQEPTDMLMWARL